MTVKQAASRLEVSVATVYGLVAAGKLRCNRVGLGRGAIRISDEHLAEFLRGSESTPQAEVPPTQRHRFKHLRTS